MALHDKASIQHKIQDQVYASVDLSVSMPKYQFPQNEQEPRHAYAVVRDELMLDGKPNEELILALKREVKIERCMFELATPRVGSTTVQIYAGKKFLIKTFGPDVNLGNVTPDVVIETETTRLGLGSSGPLDLM